MRLQLLLPRLSAAMSEGTLVAWHKEEGEEIAYGDELCDIVVDEVARLRRRLSARIAVGRRSAGKAKYRTLEGVAVRFRLISSEVGILRQIVTPQGTPVKEGDLLAVVGSGNEAEAHEDDGSPVSTARVVVNLVGPSLADTGP